MASLTFVEGPQVVTQAAHALNRSGASRAAALAR